MALNCSSDSLSGKRLNCALAAMATRAPHGCALAEAGRSADRRIGKNLSTALKMYGTFSHRYDKKK
eukprot:IDg21344t1